MHLSNLIACQLHSCTCKHHRRNSNILHCCSLGLHEDTDHGGRHRRVSCLQHRRRLQFGACRLLSLLFLSSRRVFPHLLVKLHPFVCWFPPPLFHPSKMKAREMEQGKLLSSRAPVDSSSSKTAMVPCDDPAPASSQLGVMLNCQLFTQAITEAVILYTHSR